MIWDNRRLLNSLCIIKPSVENISRKMLSKSRNFIVSDEKLKMDYDSLSAHIGFCPFEIQERKKTKVDEKIIDESGVNETCRNSDYFVNSTLYIQPRVRPF